MGTLPHYQGRRGFGEEVVQILLTAAKLLKDCLHLCKLALIREGHAKNNSVVIGVPRPEESSISSIISALPRLICGLLLILKVTVQPNIIEI